MAKSECGSRRRHAKCGYAGAWPNCEASASRNATCPASALHYVEGPPSQGTVDAKRRQRMDRVDALPADVRDLVHDYGLNVVQAMLDSGVTKPRNMRHIVETVLNEFSPTRGASSYQGPRHLTEKAREMTQAKPMGE